MELVGLFIITVIPAVSFLVLYLLMDRWGRKHDPMGGTARKLWSTTGTTRRVPRGRDLD